MAVLVETQEEIKKRKKGMGSENHSYLQFNIIKCLLKYYSDQFYIIPELSITVEGQEKIPDLAIFKEFSFNPGSDTIKSKKIPLGVIEILSPTQSLTELVVKSTTYFNAGVKSYWLVAPDVETIHVYSIDGEHDVFSKKDKLIDSKLNIELVLAELFK